MRDDAIVVETAGTADAVGLGSAVTVRDLDTGREARHEIVGAAQSDPAAGRLSIDAPLGRALTGARVGDEVGLDAPRGRAPVRHRRDRARLSRPARPTELRFPDRG